MKAKNLFLSAVLSLGLACAASAASFSFGGGGGNPGSFGNSYTFGPVSGVSVTVTAHSSTNGSTFIAAGVGQWSGGLGVSNTAEGLNAGSPNHAVDNYPGNIDYLKFVFTQSISLSSVSFGWVYTDNDFKYWIGNSLSTPGAGGTSVNGTGVGSYNISGTGNTMWLAAQPDINNWGYSKFKVSGLAFTPSVPDTGATLILLGLALVGLASLKRRFAA